MEDDKNLERLFQLQLDNSKDLYKRTEEKAQQLIQNVEASNQRIRSILKVGMTLGTLLLTISGGLGVKTYLDLKEKYDTAIQKIEKADDLLAKAETLNEQIQEKAEEATKFVQTIRAQSKNADALREIMLGIQRIAKDTQLNQPVDSLTLPQLKNLMLQFHLSTMELYQRYITKNSEFRENGEKINYEVIFEAVMTYCKLMDLGGVKMLPKQIVTVSEAIIYTIMECDEKDWHVQLKCREMYLELFGLLSKSRSGKSYLDQVKKDLTLLFYESPSNPLFKWNIAIIMADLGIIDMKAVQELKKFTQSQQKNYWLTAASAIGLIKMNDLSGWQVLSDAINSDDANKSQCALILLAEIPRKILIEKGVEKLDIGNKKAQIETLIELLKKISLKGLSNKYAKKYLETLIHQLEVSP